MSDSGHPPLTPGVSGTCRCPACRSEGSPSLLVPEAPWPDGLLPGAVVLPRNDLVVGRDPECDLFLDNSHLISRKHARLTWTPAGFLLEDLDSSHGTWCDGRRLAPGQRLALSGGELLRFADLSLRHVDLHAPGSIERTDVQDYASLAAGLASLEPADIVQRGLRMLRHVSGVERSVLLDAGTHPHLRLLLTQLDDPELHISRSQVEAAIATGERRTLFLTADAVAPSRSVGELGLHRIWVRPLLGPDGRPFAVVYLDSPGVGRPFAPNTEAALELVSHHIGLALRNASLFGELRHLNEHLEQEVVARLAELEEGRARLVSQERLATLGKLVAAIAHELNNPIGAIASFSRTLRDLVEPTLALRGELARLFPETADRDAARGLLDGALAAARRVPPDTHARRAIEAELEESFIASGVISASSIARRLARMGLDRDLLENAHGPLRSSGDELSTLAEQLYTLGRGVETIGECAANVARIVDGLKTYAHLDQSQEEVADLHKSLNATLTVLGPRIPPGVEVRTSFAEIAPFPHRPGELSQVWTNLVDNALRAMGDAGTLEVETSERNGVVRVRFTDSGEGVPAPMQERIFELHTTSRGPGAGLGLGLPICRSIVEEHHGGSLEFESRPGRTVFSVLLPRQRNAEKVKR